MQFDQSTFDSAISHWRCICAIVSVYAGHTFRINSDNLQAGCYTNLQFCQMMYTAQCYAKLEHLCFTW